MLITALVGMGQRRKATAIAATTARVGKFCSGARRG